MFRFYIALILSKISYTVIRLLGRNASQFPGRLAINICPDFLGRIAKPKKIICVTGTNGKTTTNNLIIDSLTGLGYKVLDNNFGSNIDAGIASSLVKGTTISNKAKFDIAVFEVDERSSIKIYPYIKPTYVLCTNLFRDSIKRNAHPEFISSIINKGLPEDTILILNADDPISSRLGSNSNSRVFFAIDKQPFDLNKSVNLINDQRICPKCGTKLEYNYVRYHHIGNCYCPNCDFKSPTADIAIKTIDFKNQKIIVTVDNKEEEFKLFSNQIFNIYNEIAVITALYTLGISTKDIQSQINKLHIVESRYNEVEKNGIKIIGNLCKGQNPVALSCIFDFLNRDKAEKQIILLLDDKHDAKDSSENSTWMYDADFEFLNAKHITKIIIGGKRSEDFYLRLLLAGVPKERLVYDFDVNKVGDYVDIEKDKEIYILYDIYNGDLQRNARDRILQRIEGGNAND